MSDVASVVREVCRVHHHDRARLLDIVRSLQERWGGIGAEALDALGAELRLPRGEVEGVISFYAFLGGAPKGRIVIRVCDDVVDMMSGAADVLKAFSDELGIPVGGTTPDGAITLETTPCIGMSDQAPAILVNDVVVTYVSGDRARQIVRSLREHGDPRRLVGRLGDGINAHPLVRSMVHNDIRRVGPVLLAASEAEAGLRKAVAMSPAEVIRDIKTARLRGRGGAGFPTGMKWEFTRAAGGLNKCVICNVDEGEPGTFKDRVLMTERADLVLEGMTVAAYAAGARQGLLYLRAEYAYLKAYLEQVIQARLSLNLLGHDILGKRGFDFEVRIQVGAGAYICGEETALINSCEGHRGDPRNRPPFPVQHGYLGWPTTVNNPETLCCAARILDQGPGWFAQMGSKGSPGTKLLSISGDCDRPGVYEFPFGVILGEVLRECGSVNTQAVQLGGPSGQLVGPSQFGRKICYDDLATGGAMVVFGPQRDILRVVLGYLDFFIHESCGYCTPCRIGNVLLRRKLAEILDGRGEPADLDYLQQLARTVKETSRCGFGQTSPNGVLGTLREFAHAYERHVRTPPDTFQPAFDVRAALVEAERIVGRTSELYPAETGGGA